MTADEVIGVLAVLLHAGQLWVLVLLYREVRLPPAPMDEIKPRKKGR